MSEDGDSVTESRDPSTKLPIKDLESWLEYQADQLGTPTWWGGLKAIPGKADLHRFTRKIQASFHYLKSGTRASPSQDYSAPPAPGSLNQGAFIPERLEYQDVSEADTSNRGLLLMFAALGRKKLSTDKPRCPPPGGERERAMSSHE